MNRNVLLVIGRAKVLAELSALTKRTFIGSHRFLMSQNISMLLKIIKKRNRLLSILKILEINYTLSKTKNQ